MCSFSWWKRKFHEELHCDQIEMPNKNIPNSFPDYHSKQVWENTSGLAYI